MRGIDVSLKLSSVCIVDTSGKIVKETKVASEPEALIAFFKGLSVPVTRIGAGSGSVVSVVARGVAPCGV